MAIDIVEGVKCPRCCADVAREGIDGLHYICTRPMCRKHAYESEDLEGNPVILWCITMQDFAEWNAERSRANAQ